MELDKARARREERRELLANVGGLVAVSDGMLELRYKNRKGLELALRAIVDQLIAQVGAYERVLDSLAADSEVSCDQAPALGPVWLRPNRARLLALAPEAVTRNQACVLVGCDPEAFLREGPSATGARRVGRDLPHDVPTYSRDAVLEWAQRRNAQRPSHQQTECAGLLYSRVCVACGEAIYTRCERHGGVRGATHDAQEHRASCELARDDDGQPGDTAGAEAP